MPRERSCDNGDWEIGCAVVAQVRYGMGRRRNELEGYHVLATGAAEFIDENQDKVPPVSFGLNNYSVEKRSLLIVINRMEDLGQ